MQLTSKEELIADGMHRERFFRPSTRTYCYPNQTEAGKAEAGFHARECLEFVKIFVHVSIVTDLQLTDHCLEAIRRSVTYNPNTTIYEISWEDNKNLEVTAHTSAPQMSFREWMSSRSFGIKGMVAESKRAGLV